MNASMAGSNISMNIENASVEQERENENEMQLNSSSKRRKSIGETLDKQKDRISALPDSILLHILSFCSTYDSIRTGALSKRWQYVWTSVPVLTFNDYDCQSEECDFTSSVNGTLVLCRHNKLDTFKISCESYSAEYRSHFNRWIRYAIGCHVEELVIFSSPDDDDLFTLPEHLFRSSCLKKMQIDSCTWQPIGDINWKNLKSLSIGHERINQKLISNILSGSPSLQHLELYDCCGFDMLNITSTSLRKLVISGYDDNIVNVDRASIVKIRAPNILSLEIISYLCILKVMLLDMPSLVEAKLDYRKDAIHDTTTTHETEEEMLKTFIQSLQHVKKLIIGQWCHEVLSRLKAKGFTYSPNMKILL